MGKVIAKKIRGMGLAAKIGLILVFTLLVSVFMYQGWYQPLYVQAAARVGTGGAASGSSSTLNVTIPATTAGNTLIAVVGSIRSSNAVTSISGGGTWTRAVSSINSSSEVTEIWYCSNITGGVTS